MVSPQRDIDVFAGGGNKSAANPSMFLRPRAEGDCDCGGESINMEKSDESA